MTFISFACPKERSKKKDTFLKVFFDLKSKTAFNFPKFSPRFQKFLTES
jgi:hypothetical protein